MRPWTLSVDIGASSVKAMLLDARGRSLSAECKLPTPRRATPRDLLQILDQLTGMLSGFDRISIGVPGLVYAGVVSNAVNLGRGWENFPLQKAVKARTRVPVRCANDADIQGLGAVQGKGVELVVTLGTGVGTSLFHEGRLIPNIELGHHPFCDGETYEEQLGLPALQRIGKKLWNQRLRAAIRNWRSAVNFQLLSLGGGNARLITGRLPQDVRKVQNQTGILRGIALWKDSN